MTPIEETLEAQQPSTERELRFLHECYAELCEKYAALTASLCEKRMAEGLLAKHFDLSADDNCDEENAFFPSFDGLFDEPVSTDEHSMAEKFYDCIEPLGVQCACHSTPTTEGAEPCSAAQRAPKRRGRSFRCELRDRPRFSGASSRIRVASSLIPMIPPHTSAASRRPFCAPRGCLGRVRGGQTDVRVRLCKAESLRVYYARQVRPDRGLPFQLPGLCG